MVKWFTTEQSAASSSFTSDTAKDICCVILPAESHSLKEDGRTASQKEKYLKYQFGLLKSNLKMPTTIFVC